MSKIILYGTNYGTSQQYAEELSKKTGIKAIPYKSIKDITKFETIIYLGGLYAGIVKGLKHTIKLIPKNKQPKMIIITVGLADITNIQNIKKSIKNQIPIEISNNVEIFHLRGGIDYSKLKFMHKTLMRLLYHKSKNLPIEQQTPETKAIIETFNKTVNFIDFDKLKPIIDAI